jgi:hypothetical protein
VYYVRFGNIPMLANQSASEIARSLLESDNKGQDMLGVLHKATEKGDISLFTTQNGYAGAEMAFGINDQAIGQELHGYAIQVYDPESTVGMKARILAIDAQKAKDARDRFVQSLEIKAS